MVLCMFVIMATKECKCFESDGILRVMFLSIRIYIHSCGIGFLRKYLCYFFYELLCCAIIL